MTTLPGPYFTIGAIGHRPNRLLAPQAVGADIGSLLDMALAQPGRSVVTLVTSLAEGADRIAAQQALARNMLLKAVLPFSRDDYMRDFPESVPEFSALLQQATQVIELPGQRRDAPAAYQAASRQVVKDIRLLMAVWDGGFSAGPGGTAETIAYTAQQGFPIIWVDAKGQKPPVTIPSGDTVLSTIQRAASG